MIRIAAVGDIHLGADARGLLRPALDWLGAQADVLLLAGDLTRHGSVAEAEVVVDEFAALDVPVLAVLGNHDYHSDAAGEITGMLEAGGIRVLEGEATTLEVGGHRLGVAGVKGFGGGFAGKCASAFGERVMKDFVEHTADVSARLAEALSGLDADAIVALTHYAPVPDTLRGEPPEIYPFLGSYLLGEAIDQADADLALHGHAHFGCEQGVTPGGVRVRNVAQPVIGAAYRVYCLEPVSHSRRSCI
ncbi:metallophosphoesterase family protein [Amycolatopsis nigrescens]|uniref:metallophosphoesterase family protein n=1 Tax=Amycolatopsis nigrescens TaxID=381445 RepID=UPI0003723189|nr:metallophosphoesterase [Amycolatopsis nigrescens]